LSLLDIWGLQLIDLDSFVKLAISRYDRVVTIINMLVFPPLDWYTGILDWDLYTEYWYGLYELTDIIYIISLLDIYILLHNIATEVGKVTRKSNFDVERAKWQFFQEVTLLKLKTLVFLKVPSIKG
jgi:hypothetical protein